jgi:hypothetical protein
MTANRRLYIGTPCYGGLVTQRYMQSMCALLLQRIPGLHVSLQLLAYESLVTRGRNTILGAFLDQPEETHLMFIDADIGFTPDQVLRMLDFDQDVVAGMYPLKRLDYDNAAFARAAEGEPLQSAQLRYVGLPCEGRALKEKDGFVSGVYAGAGFLLMKREALEKMADAYPETHYRGAHNTAHPNPSDNLYALFDCMIDKETGDYLSEDYAFCQRWRDLGGTVWLDTQSRLTHVGPHDFVGDAGLRVFGA